MRTLAALTVLVLAGCQTPAPGAPTATAEPAAERPLANVTSVELTIAPAQPRGSSKLIIRVAGVAPSAGWSNIRLRPVNYIQAPPDGVYDFTLVGAPPEGMAAQVLTPVTAEYDWGGFPIGLRGVRVHGRDSSVTRLLSER